MFDFALLPGENQWQYKWRIYSAKQNGLIDLDWEELSAKIDKTLRPDEPPYNECVYRKEAATLSKYWENVFAPAKMSPPGASEADLLYKARHLLADQRREYNKLLRKDARAEWLGEKMLTAVADMNRNYPLLALGVDGHIGFAEAEGVLFVADVHYGMTTDNIWNQYNIEICKQRLAQLTRRASKICRCQGLRRLHVV